MAPTGEVVMWFSMNHDGSTPPGGPECTSGCTDGQTVKSCNSNYTRGQTFTTFMAWSADFGGSWSAPVVLQEGTVTSQDSNMAATILSNGSVVGLYRTKQYGGIHRVTAAHWKEPTSYTFDIASKPLFADAAHPLAPEDPFVFQNSRGHFHALFHHRSCTAPWVNRSFPYAAVDCGGLAYSEDGVDWQCECPLVCWFGSVILGSWWSTSIRHQHPPLRGPAL
jgi:hypothetical protein